jgi:hypothetical protein
MTVVVTPVNDNTAGMRCAAVSSFSSIKQLQKRHADVKLI